MDFYLTIKAFAFYKRVSYISLEIAMKWITWTPYLFLLSKLNNLLVRTSMLLDARWFDGKLLSLCFLDIILE